MFFSMCQILALKKDNFIFLKKECFWKASQKNQVIKKEEHIRLASDFCAAPIQTKRQWSSTSKLFKERKNEPWFYIQPAVLQA